MTTDQLQNLALIMIAIATTMNSFLLIRIHLR